MCRKLNSLLRAYKKMAQRASSSNSHPACICMHARADQLCATNFDPSVARFHSVNNPARSSGRRVNSNYYRGECNEAIFYCRRNGVRDEQVRGAGVKCTPSSGTARVGSRAPPTAIVTRSYTVLRCERDPCLRPSRSGVHYTRFGGGRPRSALVMAMRAWSAGFT
jgi:hypothetical protein